MLRLRQLILMIGMVVCWPLVGYSAQDAAEELLGEGNDGNRSRPVHVMELLDAEGNPIRSKHENPQPFSTKQTCGQCHDYETISKGWHFNGHDESVDAGRPGQPWVYTDAKTRVQIPVTARKWKGTFKPEEIGLSSWDMLVRFGSHFPGGSYGEMDVDVEETPELAERQMGVSGKMEINCLACHNGSPMQDQSEAAMQVGRWNFKHVATGGSGVAVVKGTASALDAFFDPEFDEGGLTVGYDKSIFNANDEVYFDIRRDIPKERCYFCHSNQNLSVTEPTEWTRDQDVHMASGLSCTDCHRNGKNHMIARGVETDDPHQSTLSCRGCHLGTAEEGDKPDVGRLGAPKPRHVGIPTIHFKELTCTACHTGPLREETPASWKTARMHKTGLHGKHGADLRMPHVYGPVLMRGDDGKIGPHRLIWPAYWAMLNGDSVTPIKPADVLEKAGTILKAEVDKVDDWRPLSQEQVKEVLTKLDADGQAVYICGGKLYRLDGENVIAETHDAAAPYAWAMAHDVRSAKQSLGVRSCKDCHTTDSAFFFAEVPMDGPVTAGSLKTVDMVDLQGIDKTYMWLFNFTFVFRPFLKIVAFAACAVIAVVLLLYVLKALGVIAKVTQD